MCKGCSVTLCEFYFTPDLPFYIKIGVFMSCHTDLGYVVRYDMLWRVISIGEADQISCLWRCSCGGLASRQKAGADFSSAGRGKQATTTALKVTIWLWKITYKKHVMARGKFVWVTWDDMTLVDPRPVIWGVWHTWSCMSYLVVKAPLLRVREECVAKYLSIKK